MAAKKSILILLSGDYMNQFSRKKFLYTAELSATGTIFTKACGNPSELGNEATIEQVEL